MTEKKKNFLFVACVYIFFWIFLAIAVILLTTGILPSEETPVMIAMVLGSWIPTITLLVLFKKLFPGSSIKNFYKSAFKEHLNWGLILFVTVVQVLVLVSAAGITAFTKGISLNNFFDLSLQTVGLGFFWTLTQGATGEESGWRGFLQPSVEKNSGVIKSSFIVGIIWGFWHMPLWFITSGYAGIELIQYVIGFMISVISIAVIIGICYSRCRNLFVPMWIHFMFNFMFTVFTGNVLDIIWYFVLLYLVAAAGYVIWYKRCRRKDLSTK